MFAGFGCNFSVKFSVFASSTEVVLTNKAVTSISSVSVSFTAPEVDVIPPPCHPANS